MGSRFRGEGLVETVEIELGALEFGPGIVQMIGAVDPPDQIGRQALLALIAGEGFERRGGEHPAEIPDHRLDHIPALAQTASKWVK